MSLILPYPLSELRGKIGNEIYARNKYGLYSRQYVVPDRPANWGDAGWSFYSPLLRDAWQALSEVERNLWRNCRQFIRKDSIGHSYYLRGWQLFYSLNFMRRYVGFNPNSTPPDKPSYQAIPYPVLVADYSSQLLKVTFSGSWSLSDYFMLYYTAPGQSTGINFYRDPFTFREALSFNPTTYNLSPDPYSIPLDGANFIKLKILHVPSGYVQWTYILRAIST